MTEMKNRGDEDVLLAVVDGLKGFPEAILAVFPEATVQTCVVHLLRHSLDFVRRENDPRDRFLFLLTPQGPAGRSDRPEGNLPRSGRRMRRKGPDRLRDGRMGPPIRRDWNGGAPGREVVPFHAFPEDVRKILHTTNAIEALNSKLRRAVRARGHFPTDDAALKLLFLVLNRSEKEWRMPPREWAMAKAQFAVLFGERFTRAMA